VFGLYTREGFHENFDCPIKVGLHLCCPLAAAWALYIRAVLQHVM